MKFCTSCQVSRDEKGGVFKKSKFTTRWVCELCIKHKTESVYKSKRPMTQADMDRLLKLMGHS